MTSKREHLTPVDTAWLRMEERGNPVDIGGLMLFGGELPEDRLRETLFSRLLVHRRFRQRVVDTRLGIMPPHWEEEPDFSLDHHLQRIEIPPGSGEAELQQVIGQIMSEPMDFARSPWRAYLVHGLPGGTALVTRIHHCVGDGFALMQILLSLTDADEPEVTMVSRKEPRSRPASSDAATTGEPPHTRIANLAHLAGDSVKSLGHLLLLSFDTPNSLRGPLSGRRNVTWCRPIPLPRVKRIGRARGVTVNDALLAAIGGALRRYLGEHDDPVDDLAIRAIVPVNLRPREKPIDLEHGNWFGLLFVDLPVRFPDPEARVAAVHEATCRIKASQEPIVSLGVLNAMGRAPTAIEHVFEDVFARKGSLVVTNVPGPSQPLRLAGTRLDDMVFWAPHSGGLALGVSILSYAGNIRIGVRSDTAVVADPGLLARYIEEELDILESRGAETAAAST